MPDNVESTTSHGQETGFGLHFTFVAPYAGFSPPILLFANTSIIETKFKNLDKVVLLKDHSQPPPSTQ